MIQLIFWAIGFALWGLFIISTYYSKSFSTIDHIESTRWYGGYIFTLLIVYGLYKFFTVSRNKKTIQFNILWGIGAFFLHLLILCVFYTQFPEVRQSQLLNGASPASMSLFVHILSLLLYPIVLIFLSFGTGSYILWKLIPEWDTIKYRIQFPINIAIGLLIFTTGLLILGSVGQYTLSGLITLIVVLLIPTLLNWKKYKVFYTKSFVEYDTHKLNGNGLFEVIQPKLLSMEIAFFLVTFLISVSLINAIRPMPIGWDDLGVYMNYPKIMSMSGEYLKWAGMYSWQLITGTGFLFGHKAAQAFYINQLGGILVVLFITCGLSLIFERKNEEKASTTKEILSLPLILATVFYAMPMNIFQQAKDMKLDPALLSISVAAIISLLFLWKSEEGTKKKNLSFLLLTWIIMGFAFSIKVTTLMLVLGAIGLISYRILGISGFFGYFSLFVAFFTEANLWKMMNVSLPDSISTHVSSVILVLIGIVLIIVVSPKEKKKTWGDRLIYTYVVSVGIFLLGLFIWLSPWLVKNISELRGTPTIMGIISWSGGTFIADFSKIYSPEEYKKVTTGWAETMTNSGTSQNEDLGRYFGYEGGLNNYLKLPANLTFQKNQWGEFTDITYIYLAFLPALFLFIRGRKYIFPTLIGWTLVLFLLYYFIDATSNPISTVLGHIGLPLGYIILLIINTIVLITVFFLTENNETNRRLREIFVILWIYWFLFIVSAFWIVWYGIVMYFLFLALIGLAAENFNTYTEEEAKTQDSFWIKVTIATIFTLFILAYFIRSAFPHGWNNLKDASYNEFKYKILNQEESIFSYRQDYVTPIATLNLKDPGKIIAEAKKIAKTEKLKELFKTEQFENISIRNFTYVLLTLGSNKNKELSEDAKRVGKYLFDSILYPKKEEQNNGGIYRIGTFMTYLISNNRERYFDDSLVGGFDQFFYEPNHEKTIEKMKKMWLNYLLVDLNAATIDKDPRHDLTNRFERLLHTMKAKNLTLVETDNICLRLGLDEYKKWRLQKDDDFIDIAGTNYESYRTISGTTTMIYRGKKQGNCYNYILRKLYNENGAEEYPYLATIKKAVDESGAMGTDQESQQKLSNIFNAYIGQSWFALFEINDTAILEGTDTRTLPTSNTLSWGVSQSWITLTWAQK
jgi:hypothetical protein